MLLRVIPFFLPFSPRVDGDRGRVCGGRKEIEIEVGWVDGWTYMWVAWALRVELVILGWTKDSFFCVNDLEDGGKEVSNRLKPPHK